MMGKRRQIGWQQLAWSTGVAVAVLLAGCQGPAPRSQPQTDSGPSRIPAGVLTQVDPVPHDEPLSASGNSLSYVVYGERYHRLNTARGFDQTGVASWYGRKFHGRLTASGERYDMYAMTAAHKSLPLPTFARVTNLDNNISVVVRINDRGPFVDDRLIDLSYAAAAKLDMLEAGTARVRVVTLSGVPGEAEPQQVAVAQSLSTPVSAPAATGESTAPEPGVKIQVASIYTPQPIVHTPQPIVQLDAQTEPVQLALLQGHYLQLGAFGSFEAAGELRSRVGESVGAEVFVAKQSDSEIYRVQAGPFASAELLGAARERLQLQHAIDAIPVQRNEASPACC